MKQIENSVHETARTVEPLSSLLGGTEDILVEALQLYLSRMLQVGFYLELRSAEHWM